MDGQLNSSRYTAQGGEGRGEGRDGGGGAYRGDGGGYRGRGGRGRGRGRGGGRHHNNNRRHHPYNNNNNNSNNRRHRGGGPRPPGNRFSSTSVDQASAVQQQLAAMVSRVGELKDPNPPVDTDNAEEDGIDAVPSPLRAVLQVISKNIQNLTTVLCKEDNAKLFLNFAKPPEPSTADTPTDAMTDDAPMTTPPPAGAITPSAAAGPLATLLVNCAATLPLQTPAYAGLTAQVHQQAPAAFAGFANRCIDLALHLLSQHIDRLLQSSDNENDDEYKSCASQVLHLLRYLALLGKAGLVVGYDADEDELFDPASSMTTTTTIFGLLVTLTKTSIKATTSNGHAGILLRHLILSTIPYVLDYIPRTALSTHIMSYFDDADTTPYTSAYAPGVGSQALLLKSEQKEEGLQDDDDDDEDDDEDGAATQVCDTLQDLMRCVKIMLEEEQQQQTRFTVLTDAPWVVTSIEVAPLRLAALAQSSKSIAAILNDTQAERHYLYGWEGVIVFGRLPIFGSPAEEDDDNDDEEIEEGAEEGATTNENLQAYEKGFSLLDRYFLADAVRNCLICHQSTITDSGVTRGTAKDVAQQIWSICHVLTTKETTDNKGVEYILIETLLSMILQSTDAHLSLSPLYISRVLLELVRAQPAVMPQALAVGVSNLFQFYLPSLVPSARDNFSRWFAFHLTNTDYQWPKAYWDHWATYVGKSTRNSRSDFCLYALEIMSENLSSMGTMVSTCLPPGSTLVNHFFSQKQDDTAVSDIEKEVRERIWDKNEDPDLLQAYIVDGISESEPEKDCTWWRTGMIIRPFLQSVEKLQEQHKKQLMDATTEAGQEDSMDASSSDDQGNDHDILAVTIDTIVRYQSVLHAALQKDMQRHMEDLEQKGEAPSVTEDGLLIAGVAHLLETMSKATGGSRIMLEGCLKCLLDHDIVEAKHVLTWLLGAEDGREAVLHWWNLSTLAFRVGLNKVAEGLGSVQMGMVVDRGGSEETDGENDEATRQITTIREFSSPLIKNTVLLVCQKLGQSGDPKKLNPVEVDLVEGVKRFVVAARLLVRDTLTKIKIGEKAIKTDRAMELLLSPEFGLSGEALASTCRSDGSSSNGIDTLVAILEAM